MDTPLFVIIGIDGWATWTRPAIDSILAYNPAAHIVVVDNGSREPYHRAHRPVHTSTIRIGETVSYAAAMNLAAASFPGENFLFLNNDVLCLGPVDVSGLDDQTIYGRQIIQERGHRWLGLWIALIPWNVWTAVGAWDEKFGMCGFEDADYCVRAAALDIPTEFADLPFHHYWGRTRWELAGYVDQREQNRNYFRSKHGWLPGEAMSVISE